MLIIKEKGCTYIEMYVPFYYNASGRACACYKKAVILQSK